MMHEHNEKEICPFGEKLQRYWDIRKKLFTLFDQGILVDAEGLHSLLPESVCLSIAARMRGKTVVDAFGGIGGTAIGAARSEKQVIFVEIDANRFAMAKHNAEIYQVENQIQFICDDIFNQIPIISADTIHLDMPWGWPSEKKMTSFRLSDFLVDATTLIQLSLQYFSEVILHVPTVFDVSELSVFHKLFTVYDNWFGDRLISKSIHF